MHENIAIFGTGNFGKLIIEKCGTILGNIVVFIDNDERKCGEMLLGKPIIMPKDIEKYRISKVYVAIVDEHSAIQITLQLRRLSIDNVYIIPGYIFHRKAQIKNWEMVLHSDVVNAYDRKPDLDYLETHVAHNCNLNCKGCGHFSNLLIHPEFPAINDFERDFNRLHFLFHNIKCIRLMGGEPLLNKKLPEYIKIVRYYFPKSEIHIATNGILILDSKPDLLEAALHCNVIFDISFYPILEEKIYEIEKFLYQNGLSYSISSKVNKFFKKLRLTECEDELVVRNVFEKCNIKTCHFMENGKLCVCGKPFNIKKFNTYFGQKINDGNENDVYDIFASDANGWEILDKFSQPINMCKYCSEHNELFDWCRGEVRLEDWTVD